MTLEVGDIFTWDNFPYPITGEIKRRWFVYFGDDGTFGIYVYIFTTTTNFNMQDDDSILFKKGEYNFIEDCILNIGIDGYSKILTKEDIEKYINNGDIKKKSKLTENKIREIYNKVLKSKRLSRRIKMLIHDALNRYGIIGLKTPPTRKK